MKLTLNGGKGDVHDGGVEHDHQLPDAQDDQCDPPPPVALTGLRDL
jgi:hypothetical protein